MKNQKSGAILPLVCLLFLALSFIFCALLHSTRVLMPRVTYYENVYKNNMTLSLRFY